MCNHDSKHSTLSQKHKTPKHNSHGASASITDAHHDHEHSTWNRRSFMQALGLVGGGTMMLGGTNLTASAPTRFTAALAASDASDRILILVRLKGGNDGLNTIVPLYDYDFYANKRPTIRHQEGDLYQLSSDIGIPPSMQSLQSMWGNGAMKVVHGVGYNGQDLSHFRSSDIWASGISDQVDNTGVWGRYFENIYPDFLVNPPAEPAAIQIGSQGNLLFDGLETTYGFSVANPNQLEEIAENGVLHDVLDVPGCTYGDQLEFMRAMKNTTVTYASVIHDAYDNASNAVEYDDNQIARQLSIVARMIKGGLNTKVYMVTLGGFDTHANQANEHDNLMTYLSEGMSDFYADLEAAGVQDRVLSMTFSEFGRRIEENGSLGTDHGAANPIMFFGPALNGNGFVGNHPDMQNPDNVGNLAFNIDFRSVYSSVMKDWLCIDSNLVDEVFYGQSYDSLNLGFSCEALSVPDFNTASHFQHIGTYQNGQTYVEFTMPTTAKVTVSLFNLLGQEVGTLANDFMFEGPQKINVKQAINRRLFTGQYVYRITFGGRSYSKSILIS